MTNTELMRKLLAITTLYDLSEYSDGHAGNDVYDAVYDMLERLDRIQTIMNEHNNEYYNLRIG